LGRQTHQRRSRTPGPIHGQSQDQLNVIVTGRSDEPAQGDQQNSETLEKPHHLKERENASLFGTDGVIMPPRD
jgi:hypothetical protein